MSILRKLIHGTTAQRMSSTPALGQIGSDDTLGQVVVGDGSTPGGILMAREDKKNVGSLGYKQVTKTANYTIVASDLGVIVIANSAAAITFALAAAATLGSQFVCIVKNIGTGTLTIDPNAAETVDGAATIAITTGGSAVLSCDGAAFRTVLSQSSADDRVLITSASLPALPSVDIPLPDGFDDIDIELFGFGCTVSGGGLGVLVSLDGSTFPVANYANSGSYTQIGGTGVTLINSASAGSIFTGLTLPVGGSSNSKIRLRDYANTSAKKVVSVETAQVDASGNPASIHLSGMYTGGNGALKAVRLIFTSGTSPAFASGTYRVYGVKKK